MRCLNVKVLSVLFTICLIIMMVLFFLDMKNLKKSSIDEFSSLTYKNDPSISYFKNKTIHVCTSVDEHHILGFIAMVNSARRNANQQIIFHILCSPNIEKHLRQWLGQPWLNVIKYELKSFDTNVIKDLIMVKDGRSFYTNAISVASFYYTEYFPNLHTQAIHLDSDIIVQGDINELAQLYLKPDHVIAVSEDCASPSKRFTSYPPIYSSFINFQNPHIKALNMRPSTCSFNTGVYVFNPDLWRSQNITDQLQHWMHLNTLSDLYGLERGGGQAAPPLMIVFYKKYSKIQDPMWNIRYLGLGTARHLSDMFVSQGKLLHWSGPHKPWTSLAQYKQLWENYHVPDPLGIYKPTRRFTVN